MPKHDEHYCRPSNGPPPPPSFRIFLILYLIYSRTLAANIPYILHRSRFSCASLLLGGTLVCTGQLEVQLTQPTHVVGRQLELHSSVHVCHLRVVARPVGTHRHPCQERPCFLKRPEPVRTHQRVRRRLLLPRHKSPLGHRRHQSTYLLGTQSNDRHVLTVWRNANNPPTPDSPAPLVPVVVIIDHLSNSRVHLLRTDREVNQVRRALVAHLAAVMTAIGRQPGLLKRHCRRQTCLVLYTSWTETSTSLSSDITVRTSTSRTSSSRSKTSTVGCIR